MSGQHTPGRLTHAPQVGKPGHCHLAQIFDADGQSLACLDSTVDPEVATQRARRLAACWNACEGISTPELEVDNVTFTAMLRERDELRAQRDELLEALRDALSVCRSVSICRDRLVKRDGVVMYLQTEEWCRWAEDEVGPKLEAAIAKVKGGAA